MARDLRPGLRTFRGRRGAVGIAAASAVAVWVAASCAGQDVTIAPSASTDRVVVRLAAGADGPTGELRYGGSSQRGGVGSVCWARTEGTTACRDVGAIPIPAEPVAVPRAALIVVEGDMSSARLRIGELVANGSSRSMGDATALDLVPGGTALDVPEGDYVIRVDGTWPQGTAPLFFLLRVG